MDTVEQIHEQLQNDAAYVWSLEHRDVFNISLVLRAHGFDYTVAHAFAQLDYAARQEQN